MTESRYIIISRSSCPFCIFAVDFCGAKKLNSIFLDYDKALEILDDYKDFYKSETVPIILQNNIKTGLTKLVGGYTDLLELSS